MENRELIKAKRKEPDGKSNSTANTDHQEAVVARGQRKLEDRDLTSCFEDHKIHFFGVRLGEGFMEVRKLGENRKLSSES